MSRPALGPVGERSRIGAIDATRGLALLGIFLVNIQSFGEPFGSFIRLTPEAGASAWDLACFYFVKVFCEGKFYPLFSMLFGFGLALQWQRAAGAGRSFVGAGLRRLAALAVLGLTHAILVWYGDILFLYSVAGFFLLLMLRARTRTLVIVASILLGVAVVLNTGLAALMAAGDAAEQPTTALTSGSGSAPAEGAAHADGAPAAEDTGPAEASLTPKSFSEFMGALGRGEIRHPEDPRWMDAETRAYREGPFLDVVGFRVLTYMSFLIYGLFGLSWHIAAMFLFGAAILKSGAITDEGSPWPRRFATVGLGVGLPLCVLGAAVPALAPAGLGIVLMSPMLLLFGPLLSLGYLGGMTLLVRSRRVPRLMAALGAVGRMALTNYLLQSAIATAIFYYWGLGLFGQTTRVERLGMVIGIYAAQVALSMVWLRVFRFGPMEWLWRSLTYLRPQPLLRERAA